MKYMDIQEFHGKILKVWKSIDGEIIQNLIIFLVFGWYLNVFWELAHSMLYDWDQAPLENNIYFFIPKILHSSLGDVLQLGLQLIFILCVNGFSLKCVLFPVKFLVLFDQCAFGILQGFLIELFAVKLHHPPRWTYNVYMPTVFGIGVSPLVQLGITGCLSMWLVSMISLRKKCK